MKKTRVSEQLKEFGCQASLDDFRTALREIKAEHYPELTDEDLGFSRHQADDFCARVRDRMQCKRLPRVFVLRQLVNLRKNGGASRKAVPSLADGQAAE